MAHRAVCQQIKTKNIRKFIRYFGNTHSSTHRSPLRSSDVGIRSRSFVKSTLSRIRPSIHPDSGEAAINSANADIFCFIALGLQFQQVSELCSGDVPKMWMKMAPTCDKQLRASPAQVIVQPYLIHFILSSYFSTKMVLDKFCTSYGGSQSIKTTARKTQVKNARASLKGNSIRKEEQSEEKLQPSSKAVTVDNYELTKSYNINRLCIDVQVDMLILGGVKLAQTHGPSSQGRLEERQLHSYVKDTANKAI